MQKELMSPEFPFRDTGLAIRMGMTVGKPIREEQDLFGMSVVMAAWIDAMAGAGQFKFDSVGEHTLKGFAEAQKLYEINWRQE